MHIWLRIKENEDIQRAVMEFSSEQLSNETITSEKQSISEEYEYADEENVAEKVEMRRAQELAKVAELFSPVENCAQQCGNDCAIAL